MNETKTLLQSRTVRVLLPLVVAPTGLALFEAINAALTSLQPGAHVDWKAIAFSVLLKGGIALSAGLGIYFRKIATAVIAPESKP